MNFRFGDTCGGSVATLDEPVYGGSEDGTLHLDMIDPLGGAGSELVHADCTDPLISREDDWFHGAITSGGYFRGEGMGG